MDFLRFCRAVWTHWEARFGTTFAVMLAAVQYLCLAFVDPAHMPKWVKDFPPYLWLAFGAVLLFWSCYAAWRDELNGRLEAESKADERKPKVAFCVTQAANSDLRMLENVSPPPVFHLQHYGGDGARFVKVGPILSPRGRRLEFDVVNLVTASVRIIIPFRVRGVKGDRIEKDGSINMLIYYFFADNPDNQTKRMYDVQLQMQWGNQTINESSKFEYDYTNMKLMVLPANE